MKLIRVFSAARILKDDNQPVEIIDNLYIGSFAAADKKDTLISYGITHIIVAASSLKKKFQDDFNYMQLDILDSPEVDIKKHFDETGCFIEKCLSNGGKILVHWYFIFLY
jgi:protein phosphatase slingshot